MSAIEYEDCEFFLTSQDSAILTFENQNYEGTPDLDEKKLEELLKRNNNPDEYGALLFQSLIPKGDPLEEGYRVALRTIQRKKLRFRLRVNSNLTDIQKLEWEFLYDEKNNLRLACSSEIAFSRYENVPHDPGELVKEKMKVLVVIANPNDLSSYNLPKINREEIKKGLESILNANDFEYEFIAPPVTPGKILDRLGKEDIHMVHIQAHGMPPAYNKTSVTDPVERAIIILEKDDGTANFVQEKTLSTIFNSKTVRLVNLVVCHSGEKGRDDPFSGLGPYLVGKGIPAVVAMQQPIAMDTADFFNEHFYKNLARSGAVDQAANMARSQIYLNDSKNRSWGAPVVFMRMKDGLLFEPGRGVVVNKPPPGYIDWDTIVTAIGPPGSNGSKVVPFLGPGIKEGLFPSDEEVAKEWAAEHGYPFHHGNLQGVAQFVCTRSSIDALHGMLVEKYMNSLKNKFNELDISKQHSLKSIIETVVKNRFYEEEMESHRILSQFPFPLYVTTNFDCFMTETLKNQRGKEPQKRLCNWYQDSVKSTELESDYKDMRGSVERPLVFHLYGSFEDEDSLVLTEDDHLDFLGDISRNENCIPTHVKSMLTKSILLFLGYNLNSLNCRALFRGIVRDLKSKRGRYRLAILQISPDLEREEINNLKNFLSKYCKNLHTEMFVGKVGDFLKILHEQWNEKYGTH